MLKRGISTLFELSPRNVRATKVARTIDGIIPAICVRKKSSTIAGGLTESFFSYRVISENAFLHESHAAAFQNHSSGASRGRRTTY
jgi:hypothetical protein